MKFECIIIGIIVRRTASMEKSNKQYRYKSFARYW